MSQTLLASNARNILDQASTADVGLRVKVIGPGMNNPALRGRQVLYRFKSESDQYAHLQIRQDPDNPETHLWLIRTDTSAVAIPDDKTDLTNVIDISI